MNKKISNYIHRYIKQPNYTLSKVSEQYKSMPHALPHVELETGSLLYSLVLSKSATQVLELGTCLGYSSIWIAEALKQTGGRLLTIEKDENLYWQARKNIKEAGLANIVELVCGDVTEVLPCLSKQYDIVFQDSQKNLYQPLINECFRLVKKSGLLIADDTLLAVTNKYQSIKKAVDGYNKAIFADKRFFSTIVPVGDGVTISVKI